MKTIFEKLIKTRALILLLVMMLLSGCLSQSGGSSRKRGSSEDAVTNDDGTDGVDDGSGGSSAGPSTGDDLSDTGETISAGVELRWVVDPKDGSFSKKPTIPKNYSGILYLSGLNVSTLTDKHVAVRFNFGLSLEPIVILATIAQAENQGITPQVNLDLLALDMSSRPFNEIKLLYDLYDYNEYDFTSATPDSPITDPYDENLYCRGLSLQYDSSFEGTTCSSAGDVCKFAYAKVVDKGLLDVAAGDAISGYPVGTGLPIIPIEPQVDLTGNGYASDTDANFIKKCLSDSGKAVTIPYAAEVTISGNDYNYAGPYRTLNYTNWSLTADAVIGQYGLFQKHLTLASPYTGIDSSNIDYGAESLLFPRYGKMDLSANIDHLSVVSGQPANDPKISSSLSASGLSEWMDGCNLRVSNYDPDMNEGIGSCNISATIEIVEVNPSTMEVVGDPIATSTSVKLQLTRASNVDDSGNDVLYNSFKRCSSSSTCAANECCFNERCWSDQLVSMCIENAVTDGNYAVGENCTSDYQCSSLCCNTSTSKCAVHDNTLTTPVLCSHPAGSQCVSKEWCQQENISTCLIVKTGPDAQGNMTCALRCYNELQYGECKSGICVPPIQPISPTFDANNPNCTNAVDAPVTI